MLLKERSLQHSSIRSTEMWKAGKPYRNRILFSLPK